MAAALPHLVHQRRGAAGLLRQRAHVAHILQRQVNAKARLQTSVAERAIRHPCRWFTTAHRHSLDCTSRATALVLPKTMASTRLCGVVAGCDALRVAQRDGRLEEGVQHAQDVAGCAAVGGNKDEMDEGAGRC